MNWRNNRLCGGSADTERARDGMGLNSTPRRPEEDGSLAKGGGSRDEGSRSQGH